MSMYQNQNITVLRDAKQGDANFDTTIPASQQAFVRLQDGTEKAVRKTELTG